MGLIVTRAPFRISFAGGGTDLPAFYEQEYGAVLSTTIDKYVYVMINARPSLFGKGVSLSCSPVGSDPSFGSPDLFKHKIRVSYSSTENVQNADEIQHPIVRESLKLVNVENPIDISTVADVPAGTGLGSSSTFTVALLHGLHALRREKVTAQQLAEEAAYIELDLLKRPIGKQDHFAAAFGGLNLIRFLPNHHVTVSPMPAESILQERLFPYLMLFYTKISRDAGMILEEQKAKTSDNIDELRKMREHAHQLEEMCMNELNPVAFGEMLHETWVCKRELASTISNSQIDCWYQRAREAGCLGGKICGAGGGGFLLLVVDPKRKEAIRNALSELPELEIRFESRGSSILWCEG